MKPIFFKGTNTVFARNQPPYIPLPAHRDGRDPWGRMTTCWQLTMAERVTLLFTGRLWSQLATFQNPPQPQKLSVEPPDLTTAESML